MTMIENVYGAILYTALLMVVSFIFWVRGRDHGIRETIQVMRSLEPAALERVKVAILEMLDVKLKNQ